MTSGATDEGSKNKCLDMQTKYSVQPGRSWGYLPSSLQRQWKVRPCAAAGRGRVRRKEGGACVFGQQGQDARPAVGMRREEQSTCVGRGVGLGNARLVPELNGTSLRGGRGEEGLEW